jgi:hypothetical protein
MRHGQIIEAFCREQAVGFRSFAGAIDTTTPKVHGASPETLLEALNRNPRDFGAPFTPPPPCARTIGCGAKSPMRRLGSGALHIAYRRRHNSRKYWIGQERLASAGKSTGLCEFPSWRSSNSLQE